MIKINFLFSKNPTIKNKNKEFLNIAKRLNFNFSFSLFQKKIYSNPCIYQYQIQSQNKINKKNFSNKFTNDDNINNNSINNINNNNDINNNTIDEIKKTENELSEIKEIFSSLLQNPCSTIKPTIEGKKGIYKIENIKEKNNNNSTKEKEENKEKENEQNSNDVNFLYDRLIRGNELYVAEKTFLNQNYFIDMAKTQTPKFLLIGCSDSRVPPNELTKSNPGEIFIHRNIANQVNPHDLNCMSVIQYAVEYLKIDNIIVMGHTKCGGIVAANNKKYLGLIDQWLTSIKDIAINRKDEFEDCKTEEEFVSKLTEVNVKIQCINVCKTPFVQKAWNEGRNLHVHGWILDIETGLIKDLSISNKDWNDVKNIYDFVFE
jgi:carbonic anhydrase